MGEHSSLFQSCSSHGRCSNGWNLFLFQSSFFLSMTKYLRKTDIIISFRKAECSFLENSYKRITYSRWDVIGTKVPVITTPTPCWFDCCVSLQSSGHPAPELMTQSTAPYNKDEILRAYGLDPTSRRGSWLKKSRWQFSSEFLRNTTATSSRA